MKVGAPLSLCDNDKRQKYKKMSLLLAIILVWLLQSLGWVLSQLLKKNDIVDIFWGIGILLVTLTALLWNGFQSVALIIITLLTTIWAGRLSYHIFTRNHGQAEDRRYQELSKNWKNPMLDSYLQIWILQGGLMIALGMSALSLTGSGSVGSVNLLILGCIIWAGGFYFQYTGDKQLKAFQSRSENAGKIMTSGLWAKTRHPNYFGEVVMWWGIWLIAASSIGWWAVLALISPVAITYLILKVSGIPMAEANLDIQNRPDWIAYKKRTNAFLPWPSKK